MDVLKHTRMLAGADPGFSEYRSLKEGGAAPHAEAILYRVFYYYNTKIMPNAKFRGYLSKYKEVLNQLWSRGCGGCNPSEDIARLFQLSHKVLK